MIKFKIVISAPDEKRSYLGHRWKMPKHISKEGGQGNIPSLTYISTEF